MTNVQKQICAEIVVKTFINIIDTKDFNDHFCVTFYNKYGTEDGLAFQFTPASDEMEVKQWCRNVIANLYSRTHDKYKSIQ